MNKIFIYVCVSYFPPLNQEILQIEGENQVGADQQAGPTLHSVAITTDVLVYDGAAAAAEVSSLMESL